VSLGIYKKPHPDSLFTSSNPFTVTFDGRLGGKIDQVIYIRNDNKDRWYSDIVVYPQHVDGEDIPLFEEDGYFMKMMEKDIAPVEEEWAAPVEGQGVFLSESLGNSSFGDIVTFVPVWVRIAIPEGWRIQTIKNIMFALTATENLVDG
jgi:hypothetical protein